MASDLDTSLHASVGFGRLTGIPALVLAKRVARRDFGTGLVKTGLVTKLHGSHPHRGRAKGNEGRRVAGQASSGIIGFSGTRGSER